MKNTTSPKKEGRFLVALKNQTKSTISKVKNELGVQLASSEELNSEVRLQDIMSKDDGVLFKNLGIAVVDGLEVEKLQHAAYSSKSPILYFEREQDFHTLGKEDDLIQEIKDLHFLTQNKIDELVEFLKKNKEDPKNIINTWGLDSVKINNSKLTGKDVNVAILDTGFYSNHQDFVGRNIEGRSFITGEDWKLDGNGHGTHCTGTATGDISKETGERYGVAKGANIRIGKVLSDRGSGGTSGIVDAIDWAIEKNFRVISMSLGIAVSVGQAPSLIFEQVGQKALDKNCLLVAAAGNDSQRPNVPRPVSSPANSLSIMAVAALQEDLGIASFSNGGINASNGGRIDVSAPGVNVYSSYSPNAGNGSLYRNLNGTSMATPHVAGIAALYMEAYPTLSATEIWLKIEKNSLQLNNQLVRDVGNGLVQVV